MRPGNRAIVSNVEPVNLECGRTLHSLDGSKYVQNREAPCGLYSIPTFWLLPYVLLTERQRLLSRARPPQCYHTIGMSALTVELPESLYRKVAELARADGISIEQFVATATAEKMASLLTTDYLRREAALGSRADFEAVLRKVPNVPPEPYDELPKA